MSAMLADIAQHEPAGFPPILAELFDEYHMAPVRAIQTARVVIALAAHLGHTVICRRQPVPLLAGHFTGLAADADGGVREKSHAIRHYAFSTLHTKALAS